MRSPQSTDQNLRLKITVRGAVQGVGFRPFVFRLAEELGLAGWVKNTTQGVFIEAEGSRPKLQDFLSKLEADKPPRSFIQSLESSWLDAVGYEGFSIRSSKTDGAKTALVMPDIATCLDCLQEIFNPANRRFRYPFTNCTHCGPRFSIIEALPYDRAHTSMRSFKLCDLCRKEFDNPRNRRFHAQPNACPVCGPRLEFWDNPKNLPRPKRRAPTPPRDHVALLSTVQALRNGQIAAVKGIGGFHLLVDARNENAVQLLRARKQREEKPFALLFPSLEMIEAVCEVSQLEKRLLCSPEAPIVLLRKIVNRQSSIANSVAPGNPYLGVMLPSNPLHHLLMAELKFPVVATSGNLSDEPICTDEREALERLRDIADVFLVHNRPIVRHVDDSIVREMNGREIVLRRARGYAPLPVQLESKPGAEKPETVLAVGAHLKNAVALAVEDNVFLSQHIGDLETEQANQAFRKVAGDLQKLYGAAPEIISADLHPDYLSTKFAEELTIPGAGPSAAAGNHPQAKPLPTKFNVQHHVAHVLSCVAENQVALPALGIAWDGTGYGTDGTIWGGEFFLVAPANIQRIAHFRPFRLPGGDRAVKEPRRVALGLLYELYGEAVFEMGHLPPLQAIPPVEMITLRGMLQRSFNSPFTSSVGRLFDAVAALTNLREQTRFEGQAAMELEYALDGVQTQEAYNISLTAQHLPFVADWSPMMGAILSDVRSGVGIGLISAKFHNALAEIVVKVAKRAGQRRVVLSGGCFQNKYLTERVIARLQEEQFQPYWHQRVPTNDGGIALGQVYAARHHLSVK